MAKESDVGLLLRVLSHDLTWDKQKKMDGWMNVKKTISCLTHKNFFRQQTYTWTLSLDSPLKVTLSSIPSLTGSIRCAHTVCAEAI